MDNLEHLEHLGACTGPLWIRSKSEKIIESLNPSTGKIIATVVSSNLEDYEEIITASKKAQLDWKQVPAPVRGEFIRRMGNMLRKHKDSLGTLIAKEMGKIKQEGDGEVQEMIDIADFAVGQSRMLYGKTMHSERPMHRMYEQWQPLGVVGVISAFNFPMAVWAWNAFIAAVCGNTVIWKPSSQTPLCAIAVQNLCNLVMHDMGYESIFSLYITNDPVCSDKLVEDKRIALVSFTGSTRVGRGVGEKVAKRFGKSLLELSGNNAIIVDKTADLDLAIPAIVFGAVGTAGQRCTSTRRVFVHGSIINDVLEKLKIAYGQIKIGDPQDENTLMGPLISKKAVDEYNKTINALGNTIEYGGQELLRDGFFVQPTIAHVGNNNLITHKETFAPILYVIAFDTIDGAIEMQNEVAQGLSSAIFTRDIQVAEQFLSTVGSDCGIANVNIGTSGAEIGGAFGGEKDTGGGREAGSDSWQQYMFRQTSTINYGSDLPLAQGIQFKL